jgi:hypothetical protein
MNLRLSSLVALSTLAAAAVGHAQTVLFTDRLALAEFEAAPPRAAQLAFAFEEPPSRSAHASTVSAYSIASGPSVETLARQPTPGSGGLPNPQFNLVARLAVAHDLTSGPLRPFVGLNVGRLYGEQAREDWTAAVGAGARYFVQTRTYVRAAVDYGWMFSPARRGWEARLEDGTWAWSLGLGFAF